MRNALLPTITVIATQLGYLIGGLVVVEIIFNYQGIGRLILTAATSHDTPMLEAGVLVVGVVYLLATLIADVLYALLNPRIRHAGATSDPAPGAADADDARGAADARSAARRETLRALLRSKSFIIGVIIVGFWVLCAIGQARLFQDPYATSLDVLKPPSSEHWFGTDRLGRDVFARVIAGARDILIVAPAATVLGTVLGTALGLVMGYMRGLVDDILGRIVDAVLALPVIIVALLAVIAVGPSTSTAIIVIGLVFTPLIARTVRAAVLSERELEYVSAAKLRGERAPYIMFVEILPNVLQPVIVEFTVRLGYAIFTIATLSLPRPRHPAAVARLGPSDLGGLHVPVGRRLVADAVPGAGDRHAGDRDQPDRGCDGGGVRPVSATATSPRPRGARPRRRLPRARRRPPGAAVAQLHGRGRQVVRPGRRVRLRQVDRCAGRRPLPAAQRQGDRRLGQRRRQPTCSRCPATICHRTRAGAVSMVYQDPGKALNPSIRVGRQVAEVFEVGGASKDDARGAGRRRCWRKVQIADPASVMERYPAPAVGRHAAAGRDRHGAGPQPGAADPRRADDRPRRDRRGRGARPGGRPAHGVRELASCSSATTWR